MNATRTELQSTKWFWRRANTGVGGGKGGGEGLEAGFGGWNVDLYMPSPPFRGNVVHVRRHVEMREILRVRTHTHAQTRENETVATPPKKGGVGGVAVDLN